MGYSNHRVCRHFPKREAILGVSRRAKVTNLQHTDMSPRKWHPPALILRATIWQEIVASQGTSPHLTSHKGTSLRPTNQRRLSKATRIPLSPRRRASWMTTTTISRQCGPKRSQRRKWTVRTRRCSAKLPKRMPSERQPSRPAKRVGGSGAGSGAARGLKPPRRVTRRTSLFEPNLAKRAVSFMIPI